MEILKTAMSLNNQIMTNSGALKSLVNWRRITDKIKVRRKPRRMKLQKLKLQKKHCQFFLTSPTNWVLKILTNWVLKSPTNRARPERNRLAESELAEADLSEEQEICRLINLWLNLWMVLDFLSDYGNLVSISRDVWDCYQ